MRLNPAGLRSPHCASLHALLAQLFICRGSHDRPELRWLPTLPLSSSLLHGHSNTSPRSCPPCQRLDRFFADCDDAHVTLIRLHQPIFGAVWHKFVPVRGANLTRIASQQEPPAQKHCSSSIRRSKRCLAWARSPRGINPTSGRARTRSRADTGKTFALRRKDKRASRQTKSSDTGRFSLAMIAAAS